MYCEIYVLWDICLLDVYIAGAGCMYCWVCILLWLNKLLDACIVGYMYCQMYCWSWMYELLDGMYCWMYILLWLNKLLDVCIVGYMHC